MTRNMFFAALAAAVVAGCASVPEKSPATAKKDPADLTTSIKKVVSPSLRESKMPYKLGIARYTMYAIPFGDAVAITERIDCHYMSMIEESISYGATDAEIAAYKAKLAAHGITVDTLGPVYFKDEKTIDRAFKFAKRYGMKMISCVPYEERQVGSNRTEMVESEPMLDVLEKMVKKYDIKAAIHNHGPEMPKLFPTAESIWKRIEKRDRRIGFCFDIGHQARFGGGDPVRFIREHADRIHDVHLKNIKIDPVKNFAKEGPRGELDIPGVLLALAEIGFDGVLHIEYEKDHEDNFAQLAESIGYYRGVMDTLRVKAKMQPVPDGANVLSAAEQAEGFRMLFDGKNLPTDMWVGVKNGCTNFPAKGWFVQDGCLTMRPVNGIANGQWFPLPPEDQKLGGGGDIVTREIFENFVFKFDFRLTEAANSGVKYFYDPTVDNGTCEEYQVLDEAHPDSGKGRDGNRRVASLYDLMPAHAEKLVRPLGHWNSGMIVAKDGVVEHWLNGQKVLSYRRGDAAFRAAVQASKYATWGKSADGKSQPWGENRAGRLLLQDHSDSTVSFCNLKVKKL